MASTINILALIIAVLALVQGIEAWIPPYYPGYNPGFIPGFNPYMPGLPFVPGFPGAPPPYYDDNRVIDHSSPASSLNSRHHPQDWSHCSDPSSLPSSPTPLFGSPFSSPLGPINWLFRKWPIHWNIPPANTQYYNTGNENGWSKLKTWSWSF